MKRKKAPFQSVRALFALMGMLSLTACVDDSYDMSKDIDLTMGLGSEGLQLKVGSTEKIMLADLLETSDDVKTDAAGLYYLVEDGQTDINFSVGAFTAAIDNTTLSPSYDVITYDDIASTSLPAGTAIPVPSGYSYAVSQPVTAEADMSFDLTGIEDEVKWIKKVLPATETNTMHLELEVEQSNGLHFAISEINGLQLTFPDYIHLTQPSNGTVSADGRTYTINNYSGAGVTTYDLGTIRVDEFNLQGEEGKVNGGTLSLRNKVITMSGRFAFTTTQAFNMSAGQNVKLRLYVSLGRRGATQSEVNIAQVTGRFSPVVNPRIDDINVSDNLPDFLQDDKVTIKAANPTVKFPADMSNIPMSFDLKAVLNGYKDNAAVTTISLPESGKAHAITGRNNVIYFHQGDAPFDPAGVSAIAETHQVSNISSIFEKLPDFIRVDVADGKVQAKDEDFTVVLDRNYSTRMDYQMLVPFEFNQGTRIVYNDSVEGMNKDLKDYQADGIVVTAEVINAVPMQLIATAEPQDVAGQPIPGITVTSATIAPANAVRSLATADIEQNAVTTPITIEMDLANPADLQRLDRLMLKIEAEGTQPGEGVLSSNQYIKVTNMRLRLKGQIIGNFN